MEFPARTISPISLIFSWRRLGKPWALTFWSVAWNLSSWPTLYLFSDARVTFNGRLITSLTELISIHPVFAPILLLPPIGILLAYHSLGMWLNQTHLMFDYEQILVLKRPLPWPQSRKSWNINELQKQWPEQYSPGFDNGAPLLRLRLKGLKSDGLEVIIIDNLLPQELNLIEDWLTFLNEFLSARTAA